MSETLIYDSRKRLTETTLQFIEHALIQFSKGRK